VELKYIQNLSKESADIYLYDEVGSGVNAAKFVAELNYLADSLQIPVINVRINSPGGSVIDGLGIFAAIQNCKAVVNTYIDGVAASAAGFIAMAGKKRCMATHGLLMMHGVSGGDSPEAQKAISAMEDSISTILSNNSGMSMDEVKQMMANTTWLNATQCLEMKFIDAIYDNTPKKRMATNELMELVNSIVKPNIKKMNKVLNYFNLEETATEDVVIEKIEAVKTEADKVEGLEAENKTLKEKVEALEAEKTEREENEKTVLATTEVENAINAGKFSADKKEDLIKTAKNDLDGFKNLVASINVAKAPDLANVIGKGASKPEGRDAWSIRDWEKNDPAGLKNIIDNEPETYKKMYDAFYLTGK